MRQIRLAGGKDKDEVSALRVAEFSRSRDFRLLKPHLLNWSDVDDLHPVLGIWDENSQVVATLRLIRVDNMALASEVLEADLPQDIRFPGLVFNSAATRKSHRCQGLNQLLRYYAVQSAQAHGMQTLLSPIYQSAPRIAFMKKLGYTCRELSNTWQTKVVPNSPRILAALEREAFSDALKILKDTVPELIKKYPWAGPSISL